VKLLIDAGANPAKKNEVGWTAEDFARSGEQNPHGAYFGSPQDLQPNCKEIRRLLAAPITNPD
jgi:hypothetical protein